MAMRFMQEANAMGNMELTHWLKDTEELLEEETV